MQSTNTVGELWVSYHFFFKYPREGLNNFGYSHFEESPSATCAASTPLGTSGLTAVSGSNLIGISSTANTMVLQNPGTYLMSANWDTSNNNIAALATISPGANITSINSFLDQTVPSLVAFNASGNKCVASYTFTVTKQGTGAANTLTFAGLTSMTGGSCDIWITGLPYTLTPN